MKYTIFKNWNDESIKTEDNAYYLMYYNISFKIVPLDGNKTDEITYYWLN